MMVGCEYTIGTMLWCWRAVSMLQLAVLRYVGSSWLTMVEALYACPCLCLIMVALVYKDEMTL